MAEGIMRSLVRNLNLEVTTDSCGTGNYHIGEAPDQRAQITAKKHGVDISDLRARQFIPADFNRFDLIYTMDGQNYLDVISQSSEEAHQKKVHLILEEIEPDSRMEVPDPYFGGEAGFEHVFELLENACEQIVKNRL